jgi:hypothetical protein
MSKGDRDARVLQDATNAKYMACLARIRALRDLAPNALLRDVFPSALDYFMERVDALPDLVDGQRRCVTCLQDLAPFRKCTCLYGPIEKSGD